VNEINVYYRIIIIFEKKITHIIKILAIRAHLLSNNQYFKPVAIGFIMSKEIELHKNQD